MNDSVDLLMNVNLGYRTGEGPYTKAMCNIKIMEECEQLFQVAMRFINCPSKEFDQEIANVLRVAGIIIHADSAKLFQFLENRQDSYRSYEWCADGINACHPHPQTLTADELPWLRSRSYPSGTIHFIKITDTRGAEKTFFQAQCVRSVILYPLYNKNEVIGFLKFCTTRAASNWSFATERIVKMASEILVHALTRKCCDEENQQRTANLERCIANLNNINTELEAFTYSVSHDLRAPLWHITNFISALTDAVDASMQNETFNLIKQIKHASEQMTEHIDALLMLSRLSREVPTIIPISISALAQEVVMELRNAEPDRCVTVTIEPDMQDDVDPRLMCIALENLLGNAWKYTSKQENAVIEIGKIEKNTETIYHIRDNGVGFNMAHYDRLFIPFQRLHSSRDFSGTGIGLATVQRIIHRHGGRIWAESEVGRGTTIYFTLHSPIQDMSTLQDDRFCNRE